MSFEEEENSEARVEDEAGSSYLSYIWGWAITQLVLGFGGLAYTTIRIADEELYESELLNELAWQGIWSGVFNWGLGILLTALALSAIRDFLKQS